MQAKKVNHIAIIMDGNGRWAARRGWPRVKGHHAGTQTVKKVVRTCLKLNIRFLSLYAFSTENWSRPCAEIRTLMRILAQFIRTEREELHKNNIRLIVSGDISPFPPALRKEIGDTIRLTSSNTRLVINIALNYGGRSEIIRAVRRITAESGRNGIKKAVLTEESFRKYLDNGTLLPDPDLLIRTSGELRISNFMLWQIAYTELYFTRTLWPDFGEKHLKAVLRNFQKRHRRFGGL